MNGKYYKIKCVVPHMIFNILKKVEYKGKVDWFLSENDLWHREAYLDSYFTMEEINEFDPMLRDFVLSKFCVLEEL